MKEREREGERVREREREREIVRDRERERESERAIERERENERARKNASNVISRKHDMEQEYLLVVRLTIRTVHIGYRTI